MTEEGKITDNDSGLEDEMPDFGQQLPESTAPKVKLDKMVLLSVAMGIMVVFFVMPFINTVIVFNVSEQKTAYYLSIIASNILFALLIIVIKSRKQLTWTELGWKKANLLSGLLDVLKTWGVIWILHMIYSAFLYYYQIIPENNEPLLEILEKPSLFNLILNIFLIAVAAAFIEETLFRGILFGSMRTYFGTWTAIILSAVIFSALHMEWIGFVPRFILGVGLGYLYVKHDSIYPSIGLHALNNLLAVILISVYPQYI